MNFYDFTVTFYLNFSPRISHKGGRNVEALKLKIIFYSHCTTQHMFSVSSNGVSDIVTLVRNSAHHWVRGQQEWMIDGGDDNTMDDECASVF